LINGMPDFFEFGKRRARDALRRRIRRYKRGIFLFEKQELMLQGIERFRRDGRLVPDMLEHPVFRDRLAQVFRALARFFRDRVLLRHYPLVYRAE